ncbi:hypothetical protein ACI2OX_06420 [Bacillus sp. N9]
MKTELMRSMNAGSLPFVVKIELVRSMNIRSLPFCRENRARAVDECRFIALLS